MKDYLFSHIKKRQYTLFLGDTIVISLAIFISYSIRVWINLKNPSLYAVFSKISPWQIIVIISHLFTLYLLDQYNLNRIVNTIRSSVMTVLSVWLAGLIISGVFFFFPKYVFGRQVLLIHLVVVSVFVVSWRLLFIRSIARETGTKRLAVIGEGQIVSSFIEDLAHIPNSGYKATSICVSDSLSPGSCSLPIAMGNYGSVLELLDSGEFDALAVDSTCGSLSDNEIRRILQLRLGNKAVYDLPTLYMNLTGKVPLFYIDGRWLLASHGLQGEMSLPYVRAKRFFDFVLALLLIGVTSPLFALIAMAIKMDSKGDVFFVQERLGIERKPFRCCKFRTMVQDAESKSGPVWSKEKDPRITRVGRILRKTRLDELPQFWNVLKGDMSFVGPRPIREHFANRLAEMIPFYGLKFGAKPGLSGWAQVNHDYGGSEEGQLEKFQYELFYIENMSLFLDLLVVFKTVHKMFRGGGM